MNADMLALAQSFPATFAHEPRPPKDEHAQLFDGGSNHLLCGSATFSLRFREHVPTK